MEKRKAAIDARLTAIKAVEPVLDLNSLGRDSKLCKLTCKQLLLQLEWFESRDIVYDHAQSFRLPYSYL
jgi:hypothetical protein